jgi:NAD dependent epimerase/dehydratase family enzyme
MKLAFGQGATVLLDGQVVVPQRLLEEGFEFRFGRIEDALADLLAT